MTKQRSRALLGLAVAALLLGPAMAFGQSKELVITTGGGSWEAAQKKAYFDPFERQTGIKVVLVPEDRAKLLTSIERGKPDADMTNISGGQIGSWISRKAIEKIDYKYFDQETLSGIADVMKHEYGVGALVYAIMIAYNDKEYPPNKPRPQNWVDFFDVKKFPGPRGMVGCGDRLVSGGALEFATLASGVPKDKLYPIDIDRAFAKLVELKPHVGRWWQAGGEAPQGLIDGELAMSSAFNGRIYTAIKQGAAVSLNWNESLLEYDYWIVAKGSPNADNAMRFLAFVSQAKPQADFANDMAYGPVNTRAYKFISDEMAKWLPGSPRHVGQQVFQNYQWWNEIGPDGKSNWERAIAKCVAVMAQ